jgi:hypothetical protein
MTSTRRQRNVDEGRVQANARTAQVAALSAAITAALKSVTPPDTPALQYDGYDNYLKPAGRPYVDGLLLALGQQGLDQATALDVAAHFLGIASGRVLYWAMVMFDRCSQPVPQSTANEDDRPYGPQHVRVTG